MLRFSWMLRHSPALNHKELLNLTEELDEVGYESVLLTVHSKAADYIPIVSRLLDYPYKIKYMIAIRPYLLSPQFFAMLIGGMQSIAKDKLMINWVHGTLGPEESFDAVLNTLDNMKDPSVRKKHMHDFLEALGKTDMFEPLILPESLVSGASESVLEMAEKFDMNLGTGYDVFLNNYQGYKSYKFKKIFLQVSLLIRDTEEEVLAIKNDKLRDSVNVICGTPEIVESELTRLRDMGVTDFLVSHSFFSGKEERDTVHSLVRSMKERGLAA